jgi:hypothetical protein
VVAPLLAADSSRGSVSWLGMIILLNPFLRILTKSPSSTLQSTLHALFLPIPFKYLSFAPDEPQKREPEEENGELVGIALGMEVWDNYERELIGRSGKTRRPRKKRLVTTDLVHVR